MPAKSPLFSFVIPNYNYGHYLGQCIDSCLAQDVDAEILVIDGGSTDDTLSVLKSYGDRVRWVSEKDRGQSDALNKGVAMARGNFIAWINSDDYYAAGQPLQKIASRINAKPELDIIYGDVDYVKASGELYRHRRSPPTLTAERVYVSPYQTIVQPEVIFRRTLFTRVGGLNLDHHFAMDLDLWLKMLTHTHQTARVEATIACARIHAQAKTREFIKKCLAEIDVVRNLYKYKISLSGWQTAQYGYYKAKAHLYERAVRSGLHRVPS